MYVVACALGMPMPSHASDLQPTAGSRAADAAAGDEALMTHDDALMAPDDPLWPLMTSDGL